MMLSKRTSLGGTGAREILSVIAAGVAAGALLLTTETAARADEREQCATAADQAQQLRDEGKYRRAREQLLICARDACPAPIKRDCLDWLTQVENTAPTVVFGAKDATKDLSDVKVSVDGVAVTDHLDGKPVQMDLGKHIVHFEYQGQTRDEEVVIGAGQKNRNVTATFGEAAPQAPPPAPTGPTGAERGAHGRASVVPALVVGGIGVLGIASFAFFGVTGKSDVNNLEDTCKPHCAESDVDHARTKLIVADISLGIGIVALGVATYLFVTRANVEDGVKVGRLTPPPPPRKGLSDFRFDFGALNGGGMGTASARF